MSSLPDNFRTRLPVILLTGFLGAGKTTLLLRWLRESPATGRRPGIVMNEFGEVSVDGALVSRPGLVLEQVSGGCVCCAPDNEVADALTRMIRADACDFAVVETSGLADPDATIDVLTDADVLPLAQLQAVVTVVDAHWFARPGADAGDRVLAHKQIRFAHWLLLAKCDLITDAEIEMVTAAMKVLNPTARLLRLPFAVPDLNEILAAPAGDKMLSPEPATAGKNHAHHAYRSLAFNFPAPVDRVVFEDFLNKLDRREVTRAKGFIRFLREPEKLHVFQSVMGYHLIDELPPTARVNPVAVLIGPRLDADKYALQLRALAFPGAKKRLGLFA